MGMAFCKLAQVVGGVLLLLVACKLEQVEEVASLLVPCKLEEEVASLLVACKLEEEVALLLVVLVWAWVYRLEL